MTPLEIVFAVISALGVAGTVTFALLNWSRGRKKDDTDQGQNAGAIMTELGYIKAGNDDIKAELREQRDKNMEFMTRLVAVEESTKQAHKRINDHIEHGGHHYEHGA